MLRKTIKYTDFNDEEVEEEYFFHLSKAELVELEMSRKGGLLQSLQNIIAAEDTAALIKEFKYILLLSYGKRSLDGRRFIKNQELRDEFESSEAYSTLFMELVSDTDAAIAFFNGIVPTELSAEAARQAGIDPERTPLIVVDSVSKDDVAKMSPDELLALGERIGKGEARIADFAD